LTRGGPGAITSGVGEDQHSRWVGSMPEIYDRCLGDAVFRPFAEDLARRAARLRPSNVLEVAAGTGVVTAELLAASPETDVTATDLNPAMVEAGRARVPRAVWQTADASDLPFPDEAFDLVVCQFGVMFFPDRTAAYSEFSRVLVPSGRILLNTWDTIDTHGFGRPLIDGLERAFPGDVPPFLSTVPHGYANTEIVVRDLQGAGCEVDSAETVTLQGHAASAADVATGFCTGTPLRGEIEARGDLSETTRLVSSEMTARLGEGFVSAAMTAHVVQARPRRDG
jgi:SAM-dependent methyltransferase